MSFADFLLIPVLIAPLVGGVLLGLTSGGWYYFGTVFIFYLCFGLMEFLSTKFRGRSISKDIARSKPIVFWTIIATWMIMNVGIAIHWWMCR